jgi:hypothetical protein
MLNKSSKRILKIALTFVFLLLAVFIIWSFCNNKNTKRDNFKNFESINLIQSENFESINLIQSEKFYINHREATLKYLKSVYPTSDLENLNYIDLAMLYNSLWTWYNCESSYGPSSGPWLKNDKGEDVISDMCWQKLPGCGDKWPKLPYTPQGWIYDWNNYIGTVDKSGNQSKSVMNQINYSDSTKHPKDITGSVPGQTYWNWFNGPNPVWMYQRAIFRYNYNPGTGESYNEKGNTYATPALTPGEITDTELPLPWNCPNIWWTGVPNGGYLEVTMASEPGLAPSPPICWFDGWRGSGTWINVGKTLTARNKVDGVFKLAQEAAWTKEGRDTLMKYFNTDIPYELCKKLVSINNENLCPINGPTVYDGRLNSKTYMENVQLNFCNPNGTNQGSLVGNFATINANNANSFTITDWYSWCGDKTEPMPDSCVDKMRLGSHYTADRQAALMTFDEPLFALGVYLGYDSIQMPHSSNGNGRYQYEYLELRGYPKEVRDRDYSSFMMAVDDTVDYRVDFLVDYMPKMASMFSIRDVLDPLYGKCKPLVVDAEWVDSVRIPKTRPSSKESHNVEKPTKLNSYWNDKCPINKSALGSLWEYNITAKDHISSMFTYLSIAFSDSVNYCTPNGKGIATDVGVYSLMKKPSDPPYG